MAADMVAFGKDHVTGHVGRDALFAGKRVELPNVGQVTDRHQSRSMASGRTLQGDHHRPPQLPKVSVSASLAALTLVSLLARQFPVVHRTAIMGGSNLEVFKVRTPLDRAA